MENGKFQYIEPSLYDLHSWLLSQGGTEIRLSRTQTELELAHHDEDGQVRWIADTDGLLESSLRTAHKNSAFSEHIKKGVLDASEYLVSNLCSENIYFEHKTDKYQSFYPSHYGIIGFEIVDGFFIFSFDENYESEKIQKRQMRILGRSVFGNQ